MRIPAIVLSLFLVSVVVGAEEETATVSSSGEYLLVSYGGRQGRIPLAEVLDARADVESRELYRRESEGSLHLLLEVQGRSRDNDGSASVVRGRDRVELRRGCVPVPGLRLLDLGAEPAEADNPIGSVADLLRVELSPQLDCHVAEPGFVLLPVHLESLDLAFGLGRATDGLLRKDDHAVLDLDPQGGVVGGGQIDPAASMGAHSGHLAGNPHMLARP
jgi:hypothetical protein